MLLESSTSCKMPCGGKGGIWNATQVSELPIELEERCWPQIKQVHKQASLAPHLQQVLPDQLSVSLRL